jgi:hypothetical protein
MALNSAQNVLVRRVYRHSWTTWKFHFKNIGQSYMAGTPKTYAKPAWGYALPLPRFRQP